MLTRRFQCTLTELWEQPYEETEIFRWFMVGEQDAEDAQQASAPVIPR